jgi:hypothetical protein
MYLWRLGPLVNGGQSRNVVLLNRKPNPVSTEQKIKTLTKKLGPITIRGDTIIKARMMLQQLLTPKLQGPLGAEDEFLLV